jgi:propanol-preferring alcohol dehydrogenase
MLPQKSSHWPKRPVPQLRSMHARREAIDEVLKATGGGAHGVLVTAPSPKAFSQALKLARRKSTVVLVGLPPGDFPTPIFDVVLKRITVRGSIVGTRQTRS